MATMTTDLAGQQPAMRLPDVADLEGTAEELVAYHAEFAALYRRREQRAWGEVYLRGLLLGVFAGAAASAPFLRYGRQRNGAERAAGAGVAPKPRASRGH